MNVSGCVGDIQEVFKIHIGSLDGDCAIRAVNVASV